MELSELNQQEKESIEREENSKEFLREERKESLFGLEIMITSKKEKKRREKEKLKAI